MSRGKSPTCFLPTAVLALGPRTLPAHSIHRARFLESIAPMPPNKPNSEGGNLPGYSAEPTPICAIVSPGPGAKPSPDGRVARSTSDHTSALGPQHCGGGILQGVTIKFPSSTHPYSRLLGQSVLSLLLVNLTGL